jgi:hypothetical protein
MHIQVSSFPVLQQPISKLQIQQEKQKTKLVNTIKILVKKLYYKLHNYTRL